MGKGTARRTESTDRTVGACRENYENRVHSRTVVGRVRIRLTAENTGRRVGAERTRRSESAWKTESMYRQNSGNRKNWEN